MTRVLKLLIPVMLLAIGAMVMAGPSFAPQGSGMGNIVDTLQATVDAGPTTTTAFSATGANTLGAPAVLTQVAGTLNVDEATTLDTTLGVTGDITASAQIIIPDGTASDPSVIFATSDDGTGNGMYSVGNGVAFSQNGNNMILFLGSNVDLGANISLNVAGNLLRGWRREAEDNTAGSGAPNLLGVGEVGKVLTNQGSTETNFHTLATALAGRQYWFFSTDASDVMRVVANTGDTITLNGVTSASAGFIESDVAGTDSTLRLTCLDATEWIATEVRGSWNVDGVTAPGQFGATVAAIGYQATGTAVIATSDGLTTGLIPTNTSVVTTTFTTDLDDIVTLPVPVVGLQIRVYVGAAHEVRTVAASNVTINNVDADGTNELALAIDTSVTFECVSATAWIARGFDNAGADLAVLTPN